MKPTALLLLALAALLLLPAAQATTYTIDTTQVLYGGSVSGTISGTGTTITSYNFTASDGTQTYNFVDGLGPPTTATLFTTSLYLIPSGIYVEQFYFDGIYGRFGSQTAQAYFYVLGDFTNGFTYLPAGTNALFGPLPGFELNVNGFVAEDNISLTPQGTATTSEPSSLLLLASGLTAIGAETLRRRRSKGIR